nr:LysR substrate-binding domain-containing protein [Mesorhizobium liriopis]
MAASRNAEATLADLSGLRAGCLSIFASQTIASFWLPSRIVAYNEAYPSVKLDLQTGNTAESVHAVLSGKVDIGLIEGNAHEPGLHQQVIDRDDMIVVVGKRHPWAANPPKLPKELHKTRWAMREAGSGTRSTFEAALRTMGRDPHDLDIAFELPSNEALCAAVAESTLATIVSISVARSGIESGALVAMSLDIGGREFRLIMHEDRAVSRAARALLDMIGSKSIARK